MNKKKIGNSCVQVISIGILVIVILVFIMIITPNTDYHRPLAREKACYANMRIILGAVEMYNMDHTKMMKELNQANMKLLVKKPDQYLLKMPEKPEKGCEYYNTGDLSDGGVICCALHGTVTGPPPTPPSIWDRIVEFFKLF